VQDAIAILPAGSAAYFFLYDGWVKKKVPKKKPLGLRTV